MSETITEPIPADEAPPRRLVRVKEGRWLGGVSAGLGRYFDVNPLVYRLAFAALALAGGTGLLLYVAAWLVMPSETSEESIAVETLRTHRDRPWLLLGVGLLAFGAILALSEARFWPSTGNVWLAAFLIGVAIVWWRLANRGEARAAEAVDAQTDSTPAQVASPPARGGSPAAPRAPRPPKPPSLLSPVLGALLAAAGLLGLLAVLDVYEVDVAVALAAALLIVGAAVAIGATTGRRVGGLVLLGLVLLPVFGVAAATPVSFNSGIGEKTERPLTVTELEDSYELGIGDFTVDLSNVELSPGTTDIDVRLGIGEIVVTVPHGVAVEIDARAGAGEVDVFGDRDEGPGAHEKVAVSGSTADAPVLKLDADVALGAIEVRRG
jgi:phage shock protein PspC (stress-responsive transcriptional regulator)